MVSEKDLDTLLDLWSIFLVGALGMLTGRVWEVKPERDIWDFLFSCQLDNFIRETRCKDFVDTSKIFPELLLDAALIAACAQREGLIEDVDYSIQEKDFYTEFIKGLHRK